jgi:tetratricopeptide (TPR) repeat protein
VKEVAIPPDAIATDLRLLVRAGDGRELLAYQPKEITHGVPPAPASEPPPPAEIPSNEELFLTGLHLEQYHHPTRSPEPYWREAVRRDPGDSRSNAALGAWHLRRGEFALAEWLFRTAIDRLTHRNPNPYDGEALYLLGITLRHLDRDDEAYDVFYKASWNEAWAGAAYQALAEIDAASGRFGLALIHLERSLSRNAEDGNAHDLRAAILRHAGRPEEALSEAEATLERDRLDLWAALERRWAAQALRQPIAATEFGDLQAHLDVALDLAAAGLWDDAIAAAESGLAASSSDALTAIGHYHLGWLHEQAGHRQEAARHRASAAAIVPGPAFFGRLEELAILQTACVANPGDARAPYHLGNLLYDRRRYEEAIAAWERASALDPTFPVTWRNLGFAYFNIRRSPEDAESAYRKARDADPGDARILFESDQLAKRSGRPAGQRLADLEAHRDLVDRRDDLGAELATLYNDLGRYDAALEYIMSRRFHPWEGGEGVVSGQYVRAHLRLGQAGLAGNHPEEARRHLEAAMQYPENLGEGRHLLTPQHDLHYHLALALEALGDPDQARRELELAADPRPSQQPPMVPVPLLSEASYWRALALRRQGDRGAADQLLEHLRAAAQRQAETEVRIDFFATSLPSFSLFEDDLARRNRVQSRYLEGLAHLGLGSGDLAGAAFDEVLRLDPNYAAARWARQQVAGTTDVEPLTTRPVDH